MPHAMVPLIVLSNSAILSISMIAFNLVSNALYLSRNPVRLFEGLERESVARKTVAIAICYRTQNKPGYAFRIEQFVEGRRQFSFGMRNVETADYETKENVWVIGGMPLIVFMFAGFVQCYLSGISLPYS